MIPVMKRPKAAAIYARFSASQSWQPREWDLAKTSFPLALLRDPVEGCRWVRPLLEAYNTMVMYTNISSWSLRSTKLLQLSKS